MQDELGAGQKTENRDIRKAVKNGLMGDTGRRGGKGVMDRELKEGKIDALQ